MLKIKEYRNVLGEDGKSIKREKIDLKELEKFGFYYNDDIGKYVYNIINDPLTINMWNRNINIYDYGILTESILCEKLYDLIQAGLVEKVEDKQC